MKFSMKDFFSKCDQIRSFLWIWSHLLKKPLMENFIVCAVLWKPASWFWESCVKQATDSKSHGWGLMTLGWGVDSTSFLLFPLWTSLLKFFWKWVYNFYSLSPSPTKWSCTLKQFINSQFINSRQIIWECLTNLWGWRLKGEVIADP